MDDFNLANLSDFDLEILAKDILEKRLNVNLEVFSPGPDQGIDIRGYVSKENTESIIVQVKHFYKSSTSKLKSDLTRKELPKIQKLKPDRYIIFTSSGLSKKDKDDIQTKFSSFVKSSEDIISKYDIFADLRKWPEIIDNHSKLWLSNSHVISKIFNNANITRTKLKVNDIIQKSRYYVTNPSFSEARAKLAKNKFLVISGEPGVGKSTLAEMILIRYLEEGYNPIVINEDPDDAFSLYRADQPQIIYFDDFLGRTFLSETRFTDMERKISDLIKLATSTENVRVIFTTREYILQQGFQYGDSLSTTVSDRSKYILDLGKYTKWIRAEILYNHLYFSDTPKKHLHYFVNNRIYINVIKHQHFSPRVVHWMTHTNDPSQYTPKQFADAFIENLNNPNMLWDNAFRHHISAPAQLLIYLIWSFDSEVNIHLLRQLFDRICQNNTKFRGTLVSSYMFPDAYKEILSTFTQDNTKIVEFCNPSVDDFCNQISKSDPEAIRLITKNAIRSSQIRNIWENITDSTCSESFIDELLNLEKKFWYGSPVERDQIKGFQAQYAIDDGYMRRIALLLQIYRLSERKELLNLAEDISDKINTEQFDGENIRECVLLSKELAYHPREKVKNSLKNFQYRIDIEMGSSLRAADLESVIDISKYLNYECSLHDKIPMWIQKYLDDYIYEEIQEADVSVELQIMKQSLEKIEIHYDFLDSDVFNEIESKMLKLIAEEDKFEDPEDDGKSREENHNVTDSEIDWLFAQFQR